jgi:hypothetical protein
MPAEKSSWKGVSGYATPDSSTKPTKGQAHGALGGGDWRGELDDARPSSSTSGSDKVKLVGDKSSDK